MQPIESEEYFVCIPKVIRKFPSLNRVSQYSIKRRYEKDFFSFNQVEKCPFSIEKPIKSSNTKLNNISFEEIEEDFKSFRENSEQIKAQREVLSILSHSTLASEGDFEIDEIPERPKNPFFKNFDDLIN